MRYRLLGRNIAIAEEVGKVAGETGRTPSQIAIAWARQRVPSAIPIIGARSLPQLRDNLGCLGLELSEGQMQRLDAVSRIDLGFPLIDGRQRPPGRKAA